MTKSNKIFLILCSFELRKKSNIRLSGVILTAPCSRVGHIFRMKSPYKWKPGVNVIKKNSIRVAEVWLDEFKVRIPTDDFE